MLYLVWQAFDKFPQIKFVFVLSQRGENEPSISNICFRLFLPIIPGERKCDTSPPLLLLSLFKGGQIRERGKRKKSAAGQKMSSLPHPFLSLLPLPLSELFYTYQFSVTSFSSSSSSFAASWALEGEREKNWEEEDVDFCPVKESDMTPPPPSLLPFLFLQRCLPSFSSLSLKADDESGGQGERGKGSRSKNRKTLF